MEKLEGTRLEIAPGITLAPCPPTDAATFMKYQYRGTCLADGGKTIGLNLCGMGIADARFLKDYPDLKALHLGENKLEEISIPTGSTALRFLNVSENKSLQTLDFHSALPVLEKLEASECALKTFELPAGFRALKWLDLSRNVLEKITFQAGCPALEWVDLNGNQLKEFALPSGFGHLEGVFLKENPLGTQPPPEFVKQGAEAIARYLRELTKGVIRLREAKLLLVGQGESGKSSLKTKLLNVNDPLPDKDQTTIGVEIATLSFRDAGGEEFRLHLWDFGGQTIQRYAHQFFLTGSSVYALLSNSREQNPNFQYWLNIIEMLGGDSPVLVVQNKKAGHELIQNEATIRERFKNVVNEFYAVDLSKAAEEPDFERIKQKICHLAAELPHLTKKYPGSFANIRTALEALNAPGQAEPVNYITWPEYRALCQDKEVEDEDIMRDIITAFTTIGVCQWSPKIGLRNYVFLRPKWIIDALFKLIYHPDIKARQGLLEEEDTLAIWQGAEYEGMHDNLLRLMKEYYLCFPVANRNGSYIVPQLLPAAKEETRWTETEATRVIFRYGFRPEGILTRLICRLHEMIEQNDTSTGLVWNDAVVLNVKNKTRAFVREVFAEKDIVIEAAGEKPATLLQRVIDEIDAIHNEAQYANLKVEKLVQCNCSQCLHVESPYFHKYDFLLRLLEKNVNETVRCEESLEILSALDVFSQTGKKLEEATGPGMRM